MSGSEGLAVRLAARMVMAALLLALAAQLLALSREERGNFWLTGSLCVRSAVPPADYATAFAAARPALRPENRQPPRKVPSSER